MRAQKGALAMFEGRAQRTWCMVARGGSGGPRSATWGAAVLAVLLAAGWTQSTEAACPPAADMDAAIDSAEAAVVAARAYVGNYPDGNNDPNPVRRRFLRVGDDDRPGDDPARGHDLAAAVDRLVELSRCATDRSDRTRIDKLVDQAVQLALQGWAVSGNISLMEGLRVSYPRPDTSQQARPQHNPIPYGSLENEFDFLSIKDATRARLFYNEGIRALLASLRRRPSPDSGSVILDVDTSPMPGVIRDLPGAFDNPTFPRYSFYVDDGDPELPGDERVVPIRTQGHLMGQLLQSAARATESVGYRLWTAAYFNGQTRKAAVRDRLLDAAMNESRASAHTQFMSSLALAATVGDRGHRGGATPYDTLQLHQTQRSVDGARHAIGRIRADERPTLPVSAILAGDEQIRPLIVRIESGLQRAKESYLEARDAMFTVYENGARMFADERARESEFVNRLTELTGVPADVDELRTVADQGGYRNDVASRINSLLDNPGSVDSRAGSTNALDGAVQRVAFRRQEVENRQSVVDSYPERIAILEDQLGDNRSAIAEAEGKVTAARIALGKANRHRTTVTSGVSYGTRGWNISGGINHTYDWQAEKRGRLQADVDRATYTKELRFLEHSVAAQIRGLMLDQDRALGELRSQVILLGQAEADANRILGDVERLLERLREYDDDVANLWYQDPTWNVELTAAEERANRELQSVIENLYRLGRLLEFRWREPFTNPVQVTGGGESVSLGQPYEDFWSLESVFALSSVNVRDRDGAKPPHEQARDFYGALQQWDTTLANLRDFEGDDSTVDISLRQHVFGLADVKTVNGGGTVPLNCPGSEEDCRRVDDNRRRFQNILINNGLFSGSLSGSQDAAPPTGFLLRFPLGLHQIDRLENPLFPDTGAWNHRVGGIRARIVPVPQKQVVDQRFEQDVLNIIFAQGGISEYLDFSERSRAPGDRGVLRFVNLDNYVRYGADLRRLDRSQPFLRFSTLPARGGDYHRDDGSAGQPRRRTADMAGAFWSPFATRWYFQVNPVNGLQIENIDDIQIQMRLVAGRPGCPPGWEKRCGDRR